MKHVNVEFESLLGKTLVSITGNVGDNVLLMETLYDQFRMVHEQSCCESVYLEDVCGDLEDLIGVPICLAEVVTNYKEDPEGADIKDEYRDSFTWTFYKLSTIRGSVTLRWYGTSNGYYSESVEFQQAVQEKPEVQAPSIEPENADFDQTAFSQPVKVDDPMGNTEFKIFVGENRTRADGTQMTLNFNFVTETIRDTMKEHEFPGYTVLEGVGYWEGASEPCRIIIVNTFEYRVYSIRKVCEHLRRELRQEAVMFTMQTVKMEII